MGGGTRVKHIGVFGLPVYVPSLMNVLAPHGLKKVPTL